MNSATPLISDFLIAMFEEHGIRAERTDGVLRFPDQTGIEVWGEAFLSSTPALIQLDVLLKTTDQRVLCESYAGMNHNTERGLVRDALTTFSQSAFHVLLSAFFGYPIDFHTTRDQWTIDGKPREIFLGPLTSRYGTPGGDEEDNPFIDGLFDWIEDRVCRSTLPPGDHWVRVYHNHYQGRGMGNEVLLDNVTWPEAETELSALPWPSEPDPCDARIFLVIRDGLSVSQSGRRLLDENQTTD